MIILLVYHLCIFLLGYWISTILFPDKEKLLLKIVLAISFGLLCAIPLTYLLAEVSQHTADPLLSGIVIFSVGTVGLLWWRRKDWTRYIRQKLDKTDVVMILFSLAISSYMMTKTFKEGKDGVLSIARNVIFDFGHGLSITRSLSLGSNIPYTSPFVAGTAQIYHFMFQFWSAILEHFGLSISFAVNVPSIIGFSLLLLTIYCLASEWFGKKTTGMLTVLFMLFQSTLMFIQFFIQNGISFGAVFHNSNYFAAGPFDGSMISLFMTLNVFVNQRHLGIAMAMFFLTYYVVLRDIEEKHLTTRRVAFYAFLLGCLTLWHLVLAVGLLLAIGCLLVFQKHWKEAISFGVISLLIAFVFIVPWIPYIIRGVTALIVGAYATSSAVAATAPAGLTIIKMLILNFGFAIPFFIVGCFAEKKAIKKLLPLFILTGGALLLSLPTGILDQKYLNVFLVLFKFFLTVGLLTIWKWNALGKVLVVAIFPFIILSGVIDFMVIKNDYLFPVPDRKASPVMTWIEDKTPKNAVFLSYQDIFDPVTLSGRKNYLGFFQEPDTMLTQADKNRPSNVRDIYTASSSAALSAGLSKAANIQYILIPLWNKPDFNYTVDVSFFRKTMPVVYEDKKNLIMKVR